MRVEIVHLDSLYALYELGDCFRCDRRGLQTICIGSLITAGGPGHAAAETPLYACRACEQALMDIHHQAHTSPARQYVTAGLHHPH
ncbi:hypothetical protein [Streptomyces odonnellii]|uniref:hypothetical protein n=1 Tax=Streptomyces odonnellii TaxID=1417980 RepID=UPI000625A913|nr:hypothetical protein [Streptomyces odonnellii]